MKTTQAKRGRKCPHCGSTDTVQSTNYGKPIEGRYRCFGPCNGDWYEIKGKCVNRDARLREE